MTNSIYSILAWTIADLEAPLWNVHQDISKSKYLPTSRNGTLDKTVGELFHNVNWNVELLTGLKNVYV